MEEKIMNYRITISLNSSYYESEIRDLLDLDIKSLQFLEKAYTREYRIYDTFHTEEEALEALRGLEANIEAYHKDKSSNKLLITHHIRGFTLDFRHTFIRGFSIEFIHIFVEQNRCPISIEKEIYKELALHGDSTYLHELLLHHRHFSNIDSIRANVNEILSLRNK